MYAITDLKTSGKYPGRNEILSIATMMLDDDLNQVGSFSSNIRPDYLDMWDDEAEEVHGIRKSVALKFEKSTDVLCEYKKFLRSYGRDHIFVCHALPFKSNIDLFDRNFVFFWFDYHDARFDYYKLFNDEGSISTIRRDRRNAMNEYGIKNQKLDTWMDKLGIDKNKHHNAEFDAYVCSEIFKYQRNIQGGIFNEGKGNRKRNTGLLNDGGDICLEK